jgi:hypothetical protein
MRPPEEGIDGQMLGIRADGNYRPDEFLTWFI